MKSVVFCSSQRFKHDLYAFIGEVQRLAKERSVHPTILEPNFTADEDHLHQKTERERMADHTYRANVAGKVYDHLFRKVKVADVCFIFNKDGYLGANTNGELFAAAALGKMIYALDDKTMMGEHPHGLYEEPSSRKLIHEVVATPEELLRRLV